MEDNTSTSHTLESPWQRSQKENLFLWSTLPFPAVAQLRASPHFLTYILASLWPLPTPHCDMKQADFPLLLITHTHTHTEIGWTPTSLLSHNLGNTFWSSASQKWCRVFHLPRRRAKILHHNQSLLIRKVKLLNTITEHSNFTKTSSKKPDHIRSGKDKDSMKLGLFLCFNQKCENNWVIKHKLKW